MTCTPDKALRPLRHCLIALALLAAAAGPVPASAREATLLLGRARGLLVAGDGIAAEARLREALAAGASHDAARALMGEALLLQGDLPKARAWLAPARFTPATKAHGFRMLGRLELSEQHLPAAARAFDQALAAAPGDARLWTDIARLRFVGGEQRGAIAAVDHALALDRGEVSALGYKALLVRSQHGLAASLPWFEAALASAGANARRDPTLLAEYAATLGDMGRAGEMLAAVRRLHKAAPGDRRVYYLQAVLAARAGNDALARRLLDRAGNRLRDVPGAILLAGVLELRAGNGNLAAGHFDRLLRMQPGNPAAQNLLARALARNGNGAELLARFAPLARRPDASPYLLTLVARAYEEQGHRVDAARLLARAAAPPPPLMAPLAVDAPIGVLALRHRDAPGRADAAVPYIRALLAAGNGREAMRVAQLLRAANPGAPDAYLIEGDVAMHGGQPGAALAAYGTAARIRFGEAEQVRLDAALRSLGRHGDADTLAFVHALQNPGALRSARLLANAQGRARRWPASARLLDWIGARGGWRDPSVLADLALARREAGERGEARRLALRAQALQPASPSVRQIVTMTASPLPGGKAASSSAR